MLSDIPDAPLPCTSPFINIFGIAGGLWLMWGYNALDTKNRKTAVIVVLEIEAKSNKRFSCVEQVGSWIG